MQTNSYMIDDIQYVMLKKKNAKTTLTNPTQYRITIVNQNYWLYLLPSQFIQK